MQSGGSHLHFERAISTNPVACRWPAILNVEIRVGGEQFLLKSGRTSRQALDHWARQYSAGVLFYCAGPCFDTDVEPRRRHQIAGDSFFKLIPDLRDRCSLRLLLETPFHWRLRQGIAADRALWLLGHVQIVRTSSRIEEI